MNLVEELLAILLHTTSNQIASFPIKSFLPSGDFDTVRVPSYQPLQYESDRNLEAGNWE